ncbi:S-ribosylhomocysteine lyase [Vagococcus elongatus]|uniref:S-ribosylhomocysteine lyase n=1 Tax=Vagococcus elongatus TaxID=180344 RepID=A0A430B4C9_9ENTE|nr:S-ribosylhomocysteine lyase [Vagococcus elongatus]RSU15163.1 S-ribosylhomocysteine lyase [Vagococcus elongatus]
MAQVESFLLDHHKVIAPYVRLAGTETQEGVKIQKYDLRFLQPNTDALPTAAVHSFEHLLATWMRDELTGIIDISPMGCRTGFYMIMWGEHEITDIRNALKTVLEKIITATTIPAVTAKECGNYKDHSLFAAQEYAKIILAQGISLDPFERVL